MNNSDIRDIDAKKGRIKTAILKIKNNINLLKERKRNEIYTKENEFLALMSNPNICYETRKNKIKLMLMDIYKKNAMQELLNLLESLMGHENIFVSKNEILDSYQKQLSTNIYSLLYANYFIDVPGIRELRGELIRNGIVGENEDLFNCSKIHPNIKFYLKEQFPNDNEIEDYLGFLFHKFQHLLPVSLSAPVQQNIQNNTNNVNTQPLSKSVESNPPINNQIPQNYMNVDMNFPVKEQQNSNKEVNYSKKLIDSKELGDYSYISSENKASHHYSKNKEEKEKANVSLPNNSGVKIAESVSNDSSRSCRSRNKTFRDLTLNSKVYLLSKMTKFIGSADSNSQASSEKLPQSEKEIENQLSEGQTEKINIISSDDFAPGFTKKNPEIYESIDLLNIDEEDEDTISNMRETEILTGNDKNQKIPYFNMLELSKNISFKYNSEEIDQSKIKKFYEDNNIELYIYKKKK